MKGFQFGMGSLPGLAGISFIVNRLSLAGNTCFYTAAKGNSEKEKDGK